MALADLRALARAGVSPVTPEQFGRGNSQDGVQSREISGVPEPVSQVSRVSPGFKDVGGDDRSGALVLVSPPAAPARPPVLAAMAAARVTRVGMPTLDTMVEQMAEAMAADPVYRIIDRDKAMDYLRALARTRLTKTNDPLARGLMVGWERHRRA